MGRPFYVWRRMLQSCHCTPDTDIGSMQRPIFNTILEVRVIDMVDHCGQGLFHHIAWQNRPIQIITVGGPGYLGIWEYLLNIPGTPSPDQQFSRATILAYDGQVAVVRHYPHLLSPISVNTEMMSVFLWRGLPPIGPPSNTARTTHSPRIAKPKSETTFREGFYHNLPVGLITCITT